MKRTVLIAALIVSGLLFAQSANAQGIKPAQYPITDSGKVTTTWYKFYIGSKGVVKYPQVLNFDSTKNLWECWGRADTGTASKIIRIPPLASDNNPWGVINRDTIWIRASSGTIKYFIISKVASQ